MSFWARGSPDSVQSRRLLMPQFFSTERVKARSISTFCWMCLVAAASSSSSSRVSASHGVSRPKSTRMWPFCSKLASSNWGPKPMMRTVEGLSFQAVSRRTDSKSG